MTRSSQKVQKKKLHFYRPQYICQLEVACTHTNRVEGEVLLSALPLYFPTVSIIFHKPSWRLSDSDRNIAGVLPDRSKPYTQAPQKDSQSSCTEFNNGYHFVRHVVAPGELNIADIVPILFSLAEPRTRLFPRILGDFIPLPVSSLACEETGEKQGEKREKQEEIFCESSHWLSTLANPLVSYIPAL